MQKQLEVKYLSFIDANLIQVLEDDCFDKHSRWSKTMIEDSINATTSKFFGAFLDEQMVGYCVFSDMEQEFELLRICVLPTCQNYGIGYKLLTYAIDTLKGQLTQTLSTGETNYAMFLEVSANNITAQKLYTKCGFKQICVRKNYYVEENQQVDAIIMRLLV